MRRLKILKVSTKVHKTLLSIVKSNKERAFLWPGWYSTKVIFLLGENDVVRFVHQVPKKDIYGGCSQMPAINPNFIPKILVDLSKKKLNILGIARVGWRVKLKSWNDRTSGSAIYQVSGLPIATYGRYKPYAQRANGSGVEPVHLRIVR